MRKTKETVRLAAGEPPARSAAAVRTLGAFALLALLLAACLQPPPPPPPADPLVARTDEGATPSATVDLAPGEWADFELVLDAVRGFDLAYAELDTLQPAVVELRNSAYWGVLASSATPDYFVRGAISGVPQPPLPASVAEARPSAITPDYVCLGPCVIFDPGAGRFYLRVVNTGNTGLVADLYLYGASFAHPHEPANDLRGGAAPLVDGASGALELLGDVDYWLASADANVTVEAIGGLPVEATVYDTCGLPVTEPYSAGETFRVYAGEAVRVRSSQGRAGAPGVSAYQMTVGAPSGGTPPRDPGCTAVEAGTNPNVPVSSVFLAGGASTTFVVSVPSTVRAHDVIQFEVEGAALLEVLGSPGGSTLYSSSSPDVFYAGGGASEAAPELAPAAVEVDRSCAGPCVIDPAPADGYLVRVTNLSTSRFVQFYAFGRAFDDTTEPANDSLGTSPTVVEDASGAIETVGDEDLWYAPFGGVVSFDGVSGGLPLVVDVLDGSGSVIFGGLPPGDISVGPGEYLRVRAANGNTAAVSGRSSYFLDLGNQ